MPDTIIWDNNPPLQGPNQLGGNECTKWIQTEEFMLLAPARLTRVEFWTIDDVESDFSPYQYHGSFWIGIYDDNAGSPGTLIYSEVITPTSRDFIQTGFLLGFEEYKIVCDVTGTVNLDGNVGQTVKYHLGIHNGPLTEEGGENVLGNSLYWETSNTNSTTTGLEDVVPFGSGSPQWFSTGQEHAFVLYGTEPSAAGTPVGASLYTYSYLKITGRATGAGTFKVRSYGQELYNESNQTPKEWTVDIDGNALRFETTSTDVYIDLCSPSNMDDASDVVDDVFKYVFVPAGVDPAEEKYEISEGPYSGVCAAKWLDFYDLAAGATYWIENVQLSRHRDHLEDEPQVNFGCGQGGGLNDEGDESDTVDFYLPGRSMSQGRSNLFRSHPVNEPTADGPGGLINGPSILEWHQSVDAGIGTDSYPLPVNPGWTRELIADTTEPAEDGTGTVTQWCNANRSLATLWGGGMLAMDSEFTGDGIEFGHRLEMPRMIYAQPHFVTITDWAPDGFSGDIFNYTGGSGLETGPLQLVGSVLLRAGINGIILSEDGSRKNAVEVTTRDFRGDGTAAQHSGSALTDTLGMYYTGTPFIRTYPNSAPNLRFSGAFNALVTCNDVSVIHYFCKSREWWRVVLKVPGEGTELNPWLHQDVTGGLHATHVVDGNVIYRRSDFPVRYGAWQVDSTVVSNGNASHPRVWKHPAGRLYLTWIEDAGLKMAWSDDDATFNEAVTMIAGATKQTISGDDSGTLYAVGLVGSTLYCRRRGAGDADFGSAFALKDSTGANLVSADDTFHLMRGWEAAMRVVLHMRVEGETDSSFWWSADDAETWTRVA